MKKIIIIILIVLVIGAVVFLGYYLRSRNESVAPSPPTAEPGNLPTVQLPKATGSTQGAGQATGPIENLRIAVNVPTIDYFVDAKNSATFVQPDGQILKIGNSGPEVLSASIVKNVVRASFSLDGKKVLVVMKESSGDQASVFDTERKTWRPLPQNANGPVWSPNNYLIAYFSNVSGGSVLSLLDMANFASQPKVLLPLHQEDMTLNWVAPDQILVADKTSALWNSFLWSLDLVKKIISPVIQDRPGLETVWSSSSAPFGLMFSASQNQQGGQLWLVDKSGNALKQLNFLTLPTKCVFYDNPVGVSAQAPSSTATSTSAPTSRETPKTQLVLICAVPRDQQRLSIAILPDAYQEKALFTSDDFFEINVNDGGVKTLFSDPVKNLDASTIKIFNQAIFFINRFDKKVYSVPLSG